MPGPPVIALGADDQIWVTVTDPDGADLTGIDVHVAVTTGADPTTFAPPALIQRPDAHHIRVRLDVHAAAVGVYAVWVRLDTSGSPVLRAGSYIVAAAGANATTIAVRLDRFTLTGSEGQSGQWAWRPNRRLAGDERVIVPTPVRFSTSDAEITSGIFLLSVAATDTDEFAGPWCWQVREPGGHTRHVLVPTSDGVIDYAALTDVDPASYEPAATAPPGWWALARDLARRVADLEAGISVGDPIGTSVAAIDAYVGGYLNAHIGDHL